MTSTKKSNRTLRVKQIRSAIGFDKKQKATLRALGLAKIGREREHPDTPQIRGMLSKVPHLVVVLSDEGSGS